MLMEDEEEESAEFLLHCIQILERSEKAAKKQLEALTKGFNQILKALIITNNFRLARTLLTYGVENTPETFNEKWFQWITTVICKGHLRLSARGAPEFASYIMHDLLKMVWYSRNGLLGRSEESACYFAVAKYRREIDRKQLDDGKVACRLF